MNGYSYMKCPAYHMFFETIAPEMRVKILFALKSKAMSVNELAGFLGEEQSKISHNLRKLTECRLIEVKPKGKKRIYSINKDTVLPLIKLVEKHVKCNCCEGCGRLGE
ncbi:metalloregulator ArsR/SmtB family transcription factor [Candidatus Woesearchaeota archaeon]|nr:metalloregulator ArsR/SmtB family transcription factor [Candidatus Woesearchaeota archaeon]